MKNNWLQFKPNLYEFLETSENFWARIFRATSLILIIVSVSLTITEAFYSELLVNRQEFFYTSELFILGFFTLEFIARLISSPNQKSFWRNPLTLVDILAIVPGFIELILSTTFFNTTTLRSLRLLRFLRFSRLLRILRIFHYQDTLKSVFKYEGTILESITPVIMIFSLSKGGIWFAETNGWWLNNPNLGELFAIIGFALGIILSQKIGVTYSKFTEVEETTGRITATLEFLKTVINNHTPELGAKVTHTWAKAFLQSLENFKTTETILPSADKNLYDAIKLIEPTPSEVSVVYSDLIKDATFCLTKKTRLTPRAYDTLLHQATLLYLLLIIIFIPGFTGLISVFVAAYILYGMYHLTQDLDSILGGERNLISIDISELRAAAKTIN